MLKEVLLVGIGGFAGSVSRYYLSRLNLLTGFLSIPLGTLLVNSLGCLLIGILSGLADHGNTLSSELRLVLMVGFCGGFTTFSSFSNENMVLLHNGQFISVLLYTFMSLLFSFLAVFLGYGLSRFVTGG